MTLPEQWQLVRLNAVCELNPRLEASEKPDPNTEVTFVPMAAVDEVDGTIAAAEVRAYADVSRGYTHFKEGDVLFAKVTPCMENGKAAVARNLVNGLGFGSTEFHVLRPTSSIIPEFLLHFIRQPSFREQAAASFVGTGGLRRVPQEFLSRVPIPLPPPAEQRRIVEMLEEARKISRIRRTALSLVDQLVRALYSETFRDFYTSAGLRAPRRIGDFIAEIQYGISEAMQESGSHPCAVHWSSWPHSGSSRK